MLLTNHVLTGGLIALKIQNPVLIGVTAFSSHIVLDSLPHFGFPARLRVTSFREKWGFRVAAVDSLVSLTAYITLIMHFPHQWLHITIGMFFAALPDLAYIPREYLGIIIGKRFLKFHSAVQWGEHPWATLVDAAWAAFIISLLVRVS